MLRFSCCWITKSFSSDPSGKSGKEKLKAHFAKIDYDLAPIPREVFWEGVLEEGSMWCYPQQGSCKMRLREVYKEHGRFLKQAKTLQKWIQENFTEEQQYEKFINNIVSKEDLEEFDVENWLDSLDVQVNESLFL